MDRAGLSLADVWQRYAGIGGNGSASEVSAHVSGCECGDDEEHNLIAQAINEVFLDRGEDHPVAYRQVPGAFEPPPAVDA
jgi:hypothetical protein